MRAVPRAEWSKARCAGQYAGSHHGHVSAGVGLHGFGVHSWLLAAANRMNARTLSLHTVLAICCRPRICRPLRVITL